MTKLSGLISSHMRRESVLDFILSLFSPSHLQSPHLRLLDRMSQTKQFLAKTKKGEREGQQGVETNVKRKREEAGDLKYSPRWKVIIFSLDFPFHQRWKMTGKNNGRETTRTALGGTSWAWCFGGTSLRYLDHISAWKEMSVIWETGSAGAWGQSRGLIWVMTASPIALCSTPLWVKKKEGGRKSSRLCGDVERLIASTVN